MQNFDLRNQEIKKPIAIIVCLFIIYRSRVKSTSNTLDINAYVNTIALKGHSLHISLGCVGCVVLTDS